MTAFGAVAKDPVRRNLSGRKVRVPALEKTSDLSNLSQWDIAPDGAR
jgi:hypothetical protein